MLHTSLISLLVLMGCGDEAPSTTETTAKTEQAGKKVEIKTKTLSLAAGKNSKEAEED